MRTEIDNKNMINSLLELAKIHKDGFAVAISGDTIDQYANSNRPYAINHKTIIEIHGDNTLFKNGEIPDYCIVSGWYNIPLDTYYIELNKTYCYKAIAINHAKYFKQKHIRNLINKELIKV